MSQDNAIDRFYAGMTSGDLELSRASLAPDAQVWHSFDGIVLDPDATIAGLASMVGAFSERRIEDVRRQPTPSGFVQQHVMVVKRRDGTLMAWSLCIVVRIEAGLIVRMDEYIDRAGSFTPGEGAVTTPGM